MQRSLNAKNAKAAAAAGRSPGADARGFSLRIAARPGAPENTLARAPEIGRSAAGDVTGRGARVPAGPFKGALADAHRPLERPRRPRFPFWNPFPPLDDDVEHEREGYASAPSSHTFFACAALAHN